MRIFSTSRPDSRTCQPPFERSDQIGLGYAHVAQEDFVRPQDVPGQRRRTPDLDAWAARIHQQQRQALVFRSVRLGAHVHRDDGAWQPGPRAPGLLPVDDEVVTVVNGRRAQRRHVRSDVRLAHRYREPAGSRHHPGQVALVLFRAPPLVQRETGDERAGVAHGDVEAGSAEFLRQQAKLDDAAVSAAYRFGKGEAEPALIGHSAEQLSGVGAGFVPLLGHRRRTGACDELARRLLQQPLFVAQSEVHATSARDPLDNRTDSAAGTTLKSPGARGPCQRLPLIVQSSYY